MKTQALISYLPLLLRDYLLTRGGAMVVVSLVFIGPLLIAFSTATTPPPPEQMSRQAIQVMLSLTTFLTLVGTYGLIGQDFRLGYYRSYFAKPVPVPLYYVATFGCALLGFWTVQGLILVTLASFGVNAWDAAAALEATLSFILLGSMVLAFSRVSRLDWIFAAFLMALANPLRSAYPAAESIRGKILNVLLPPMHLFDLTPSARAAGETSALITGAGVEWTSLSWICVYALTFFLCAMVAVWKLPLASTQ